MTDRIDRLMVVLEQDTRDDDVQATVDAILMIRGVASVDTHVRDHEDLAARQRVRSEVAKDLVDLARNINRGGS